MRRCVLFILAVSLLVPISAARAETITFFSTNAYATVMADVLPAFEKRTGYKVDVQYDSSIAHTKRIFNGEAFDLIVFSLEEPETLQPIADKGFIVPESICNVARGRLGMGVKAGTPHPKIGTVEQLKETLLQARKIAYTDPATGGLSGIYVEEIFKILGIEDKIRAKDAMLKLRVGRDAPGKLISGEADISVHNIAVLTVPGVEIVGPLPEELQHYMNFFGAISTKAKNPEAAKALLEVLNSQETKALLPSKGFVQ